MTQFHTTRWTEVQTKRFCDYSFACWGRKYEGIPVDVQRWILDGGELPPLLETLYANHPHRWNELKTMERLEQKGAA
jgi:hypothetical protein